MSRFDWLSELLAQFQDEHILVKQGSAEILSPAHVLEIDPEDWGRVAEQAAAYGCRWAATWGDHVGDTIQLNACLEYAGDYLVVRTEVDVATPVLTSHTPHYPAADRPERHIQDLLGVVFTDHPDSRRWTRHQAWTDAHYPLRNDFPAAGESPGDTPPDGKYQFLKAHGAGVYEIPVGPVHAGIIEPGHFRFQAVGEDILNLEQHLGYVHKGIEKIAVGRDAPGLARLAGRVSGDSTVAHAWAACQAMERAAKINVPARALTLRAVMAERERIANHLGDIGAICNDVSFAFAIYQCSRLRENWLRRNGEVFGHRLMMDAVVPGGVAADINSDAIAAMRQDHDVLKKEIETLFDIFEDHPSLDDRLETTGILTLETAKSMGVLGYVAKASGLDFDVRRQHGYSPYDKLEVTIPVYEDGDVAARMGVRMKEINISLDLLETLLMNLPEDGTCTSWTAAADTEGMGMIEGWRGEILTYVRFDAGGRIARFFPRDPSWLIWPALERIVLGNIVPDFPVCNKSVNGSYSGQDL